MKIPYHESIELLSMRQMAIQRAIGELQAALRTYWDGGESYEKDSKIIYEVIKMLQNNLTCA